MPVPNTMRSLLALVVLEENGCCRWTGYVDREGYGRVVFQGKDYLAHRFFYQHFVEPVPSGLVLDHLCRNRACVNCSHLEAVTDRVNILRGNTRAAMQLTRTHCPRGHPYSGENLRISQGKRQCRECGRIGDYRRYWRERGFPRTTDE